MEQVENHVIQRNSDFYSFSCNAMNLFAICRKLTVLSQFISPESLQSKCFYKIAIGLASVANYEQTTELINA